MSVPDCGKNLAKKYASTSFIKLSEKGNKSLILAVAIEKGTNASKKVYAKLLVQIRPFDF